MTKEGLQYTSMRREGFPVATPLTEQVAVEPNTVKPDKKKEVVEPQRQVLTLPETGGVFASEGEGLRGLHRYYNDTNR